MDKYILNKYIKNNNSNNNKEPYQYQNKFKNVSCDYVKSTNINLINSSLPNSINLTNKMNKSYILDSKVRDEIMNKYILNDNSSILRRKKIYNRHKSIEKNTNYIKGKQLNIKKNFIIKYY